MSDSGFVTPDEGLSEVGEEDEDDDTHDPEATITRRTTGMALSGQEGKHALLERDGPDEVVGEKIRQIKSSPIPAAVNTNPSVKQEDILAEDLKTCHEVMALVSVSCLLGRRRKALQDQVADLPFPCVVPQLSYRRGRKDHPRGR